MLSAHVSLADQYAKALFFSASERELEGLVEELTRVDQWLKRQDRLSDMLSSRRVGRAERIEWVGDLVVKPLGLSDKSDRFLKVMAESGRISLLPLVLQKFRKRVLDNLGICEGVVESATVLSEVQRQKLENVLSRVEGKQVQLVCREVPDLIAGFVVFLGSRVYEGSIKHCLDRFEQK